MPKQPLFFQVYELQTTQKIDYNTYKNISSFTSDANITYNRSRDLHENVVVSCRNKLERRLKVTPEKNPPYMLLRTKAPGRAVSNSHNVFLSRQHRSYHGTRSQFHTLLAQQNVFYSQPFPKENISTCLYKNTDGCKQNQQTPTRHRFQRECMED